jgi:hypothetical protein
MVRLTQKNAQRVRHQRDDESKDYQQEISKFSYERKNIAQ